MLIVRLDNARVTILSEAFYINDGRKYQESNECEKREARYSFADRRKSERRRLQYMSSLQDIFNSSVIEMSRDKKRG